MSDHQDNPDLPDYRAQMDDPEPGATWFLSLVSLVLMVVVVLLPDSTNHQKQEIKQ